MKSVIERSWTGPLFYWHDIAQRLPGLVQCSQRLVAAIRGDKTTCQTLQTPEAPVQPL